MRTLSVIIPTYNRPKQILARVGELLPQLTSEIELIILDNCSPLVVQKLVCDAYPETKDQIKHIRNLANIGANANICRCFEVGSCDWLWLLGDDDIVLPNAIESILSEVKSRGSKTADFAGFHFSTSLYEYHESLEFSSLEQYCNFNFYKERFGNALFISSCVYRTKFARDYLSYAYQSISSCGPQLALALSCVARGHGWGVSEKKIVDWKPADAGDQWGIFWLAKGLPLLIEVPGCATEVIKNLHGALEKHMWNPLLKGGIHMCLFNNNYNELYWVMIFCKFRFLLQGKKKIKMYILYVFSLACYHIKGFKPFFKYLFIRTGLSDSIDHASIRNNGV